MPYRYETHCHTAPVSRCARSSVRETLEFYKGLGYAGVFITNHFLDGNVNVDRSLPYAERIAFYFSDYEAALSMAAEIGIRVLPGVEISYQGTDFLIYGLSKEWFLAHPEYEEKTIREKLIFLREAGALIIHAHPWREAHYIDHIRLFPREVEGVEAPNASRDDFTNEMGKKYAEAYGLLPFAGSDVHDVTKQTRLAGLSFEEPIDDVDAFIEAVRARRGEIFTLDL